MKELILIRHGEAEHIVKKLAGGWTDSALTLLGEKQALQTAEAISKFIGNNEEVVLFSSDLKRASVTAKAIRNYIKTDSIHILEGLRENNNGDAKGLTKAEAKKIKNAKTSPVLDWIPYNNAESFRMLHTRIVETMNAIKKQTENKTVIIVSHTNAIICMIHWWLHITEDHHIENIMYKLDPCSITHLGKDKDGCFTINKLNDTTHLNKENS